MAVCSLHEFSIGTPSALSKWNGFWNQQIIEIVCLNTFDLFFFTVRAIHSLLEAIQAPFGNVTEETSDLTRSSWRWSAFYIATRYSFKFLNFKSTRRCCQIKEEQTHTPLQCDVSCETAIYIWQWALRFHDLFAPYYVHEIKGASFVRSSGEAGTIVRFPANHHVCVSVLVDSKTSFRNVWWKNFHIKHQARVVFLLLYFPPCLLLFNSSKRISPITYRHSTS